MLLDIGNHLWQSMLLDIGDHLWQSTLVAVVIAGLCYLLRRDGAHVRYRLWWIASVKFLVPFSLLTAAGHSLATRAASVQMPQVFTDTVTVIAHPFGMSAASAATLAIGKVLLALWLAGSIVVLGSWARRALHLRRTLKHSRQDAELLSGGPRRVRVFRTDARIEPGVVGILREALLLPEGLEHQLSAAQLEAVLAHELCHIRRRDNLTAAVHMLVEALFWFHPLIWWIGARLVDERERACDETVVALGHDRETYAESILDVCERYAAVPLRSAAGISGSDLKRRVVQIMRYKGMKTLGTSKKLALATAAAAVLALPIVAGFAVQREAFAQETPAPAPAAPAAQNRPEAAPAVQSRPEAAVQNRPEGPRAAPSRSSNTKRRMPIRRPINLITLVYPPDALAKGLEGSVVLSFTVTKTGETRNVRVVQSSDPVFESAAIDGAKQFKYKPTLVNGQPQEVDGVVTRIVFALDRGSQQAEPAVPAK